MIPKYRSAESKTHKPTYSFTIIIGMLIVINSFTNQFLSAQETQKAAETKTPIHLSEQQWKAVEGIFQDPSNNDRYVQFTPGENFLVAKLLWNNAEIQFIPESELEFVSKEVVEDGYLTRSNWLISACGREQKITSQ